ncbi:MAG: M15 family metallopeptidase [Paracoccaceae bacterium]
MKPKQQAQGQLIAPIIVAIGVVVAAVAFAIVTTLLDTADSGTELRLTRLEEALAKAQAQIESITAEATSLRSDLERLRDEMSLIANRAPIAAVQETNAADAGLAGNLSVDLSLPDENFETPPATEALTEQMQLAKTRFNKGITQPRNKTMLAILGQPRDSYSTDCQAITDPKLKSLVETRAIGPITVTMLKPALDSLARVLARLKESDPDIHDKLGTAGALCVRFIRGSNTAISNHSWGTAIDLTLEGDLDGFADGATQFGLVVLAEYFNEEGWYWGAVYNREDSMHFEVGEETLAAWQAEGKL